MASVRALVEAGANATIRGEKDNTAIEWAKEMKNDAIVEYLTKDAPKVRFGPYIWNTSGQPHRVKGRSLRAIERDLKEKGGFVKHILHRLKHLCIGKRS